MAESILKLKVDSTEYDSKIKRAAQGLQAYAEGCRKVGGTLSVVENETLDFVKALGRMDTVSKDTRGSINEMTKAFTELSVQYNKLTDEEKNSPFGKALNDSLNTLKGRIQEGKQELDGINKSLTGGGGLKDALNQVAGKFGLNIDMVTKFGGVIGATTAAVKVAQDAFFASESNIDEWGRTIKGAEGAYDMFLQTLNNGNWSNFFNNLSQAITGARDLYDAFDRLGSIKSNNQVAISLVQAEIQQLRVLKQQGQDVDDKIKNATARLAKLQAQSANAGINAGRSQVVNTLRNGVNSIGGAAINDATLKYAADQIAKQGQQFFDTMKQRAAALESKGMVTKTQTITDSQGGTYERQYKVFDINKLTKEQQKQYAIAKTVTERETEIQKGLTVWSQAVNEQAASAREEFKGNRYALQGSSGGGKSGGSTSTGIPAYVEFGKILAKSMNANIKPEDIMGPSDAWTAYTGDIRTGLEGIDGELTNLTKFTKNFDPYLEFLKDAAKRTEQVAKANELAAQSANNLGSALASLDDPSAKAAGTVIQAIANIALSFSQAAIQARELGSYGWIAYMAAGTAALATTISTIHSLTGFSEGGEVKGNTYSSDQIPIMANAGEVVLTRAMAGNLASQLQGVGSGQIQATGILQGENILISLERTLKRKGYGELATWK